MSESKELAKTYMNMHQKQAPFIQFSTHTHTHLYVGYPHIEVRDVVLQQDLDIANTLLSTDKGEWDHSLRQQNTKTKHIC